jgi:hypothetical protein
MISSALFPRRLQSIHQSSLPQWTGKRLIKLGFHSTRMILCGPKTSPNMINLPNGLRDAWHRPQPNRAILSGAIGAYPDRGGLAIRRHQDPIFLAFE